MTNVIQFDAYRLSLAARAGNDFQPLSKLPVGQRVEFRMLDGSHCIGWKANGRFGEIYWTIDHVVGGYKSISPLLWKPLSLKAREASR